MYLQVIHMVLWCIINEVPSYVADRFDPSASFDADGEFHLADSIDYRPLRGLLTTQPSQMYQVHKIFLE